MCVLRCCDGVVSEDDPSLCSLVFRFVAIGLVCVVQDAVAIDVCMCRCMGCV